MPGKAKGALVIQTQSVLPNRIMVEISLLVFPLKFFATQLVKKALFVDGGCLQTRDNGRGLHRSGKQRMVNVQFFTGVDALFECILHGEDAVDEFLLAARDANTVGLTEGAEGGKSLAGKIIGSRGRWRLEGGGERGREARGEA